MSSSPPPPAPWTGPPRNDPGLGPVGHAHSQSTARTGVTRLWSDRIVLRLPVAAAAGLLTDLAFAPYNVWPAAVLGVLLLLIATWGMGPLRAWLIGFAWGVAFFLPHLAFTLVSSGTPVAWIAVSVAQAAIQATALPLMTFACRAPGIMSGALLSAVGRAIVMGACWVLVEQVRAVWPFSGLPWGILAFSQNEGPLVGLASLGGTVLVSWAVVFAAALVAEALSAARQSSKQWPELLSEERAGIGQYINPFPTALALGALGLLTVALPAIRAPMGAPQIGDLRVAVIQGNIPEPGASWEDNALGVLANHAAETSRALAATPHPVDAVLWPESASDLDPRTIPQARAIMEQISAEAGVPILLGTQAFEPSIRNATERTNDYITWLPGEGAVASYSKQQPVAFGEYMPYRDFFRTFTSAVDLVGTDMVAGTEPGLVEIPFAGPGGEPIPVSVGICFEVAYDRIIRESVLMGGQAIIIPTNNASFGNSREAVQQLAMAEFRAVEHARAVVQVSTMGVSAVIDPDGSIVWDSGMWEPASTVVSLPRVTYLTLSDRLGDLPLIAMSFLALSSSLAGAITTAVRRRGAAARRVHPA